MRTHHYDKFLFQIKYVSGSYDSGEGFEKLNKEISEYEKSNKSESPRRLFYLALPPSVYPSVCKMIRTYCMNPCKVSLLFHTLFFLEFIQAMRFSWTKAMKHKVSGKFRSSWKHFFIKIHFLCINVLFAAGWTRVIVEKPFGKDLDSAEELSAQLGELFDENQLYRIDHYLGKELVQNLVMAIILSRMWDDFPRILD